MVANIRGYTPNFNFKLINFDTPRWHTLEYANWGLLDATLLSAGIAEIRGDWLHSTLYLAGDRVFDNETNDLWRCVVEHTSNATGTFAQDRAGHTTPVRWVLQLAGTPIYRGAWQANNSYVLGDIVYTDSYTYRLCTIVHTSASTFPPDAANWQIIFDTTDAVDTVEQAVEDTSTSATLAAGSAANAAASAGTAATDAITASDAASSALASKNAAATSETNAATSAGTASTAATTATTAAADALNSKTAAATSATNAASSATSASTSSTNATNSASSASTSASSALTSKNAAAASATEASLQASKLYGTSATSFAVGLGSQTLVTQADKYFEPGKFVTIRSSSNPSTTWMWGQVTAYSGTSLVVNRVSSNGTGTFADWLIDISGDRGSQGGTGTQGVQGIQGIQGIQGTPGEKWFTGGGAPGTVAGAINGDFYLDINNGDVWELVTSTWTLRDNLTGPQGPLGPTGPQGPALVIKGVVANSAALPPTGNTTGDAYITSDNQHLWIWNGTVWQDGGPFSGGVDAYTKTESDTRYVNTAGDTMTAPLVMPIGSAAATSINFGGANTGMYGIGTTNLAFAISGVNRMSMSGTTITTTIPFRAQAATVAAPAYSFTLDTASGLYRSAAGVVSMSMLGVESMRWTGAGNTVTALGPLMVSAAPTVDLQVASKKYVDDGLAAVGGGAASTISVVPVGNIAATNVQAALAELDTEKLAKAGDAMAGTLTLANGTAAAPSLNFAAGAAYGMYWFGSAIGFTAGGAARMQIGTTITSSVNGLFPNGTAAAPSYAFSNNTDSGLYRSAADTISLSAKGVEAMRWSGASNTTTALGPLMVAADPAAALQVATKQYVDGKTVIPTAATITFTPAGTVAATNVQAAIEEVGAEGVAKAGDTMTGNLTIGRADPNLLLNKTVVGNSALVTGRLNGDSRWTLDLASPTAHDFVVTPFNDINVAQPAALTILRATGLATVKGDPTALLGIATKQYVDVTDNLKLAKAGDTMTGPLVLATTPTNAQHAATKAYVDGKIAAAILDTSAYGGIQFNGSMEVMQERGISNPVVGPGGIPYICDGWQIGNNLSSGRYSASVTPGTGSIAPGFQNAITVATTTAQATIVTTEAQSVFHKIEGYRTIRLNWGSVASPSPITICFWSAHHRTGTYSVAVQNGQSSRSYVGTYIHSAADAGQYNVMTVPGDTSGSWLKDNGVGLQIHFTQAAGPTVTTTPGVWNSGQFYAGTNQVNAVATTNDVFRITGVVVLPGLYSPTAAQSPLIMRSFDQELVVCQRYYEWCPFNILNIAPAASYAPEFPIRFAVDKRASPTFSVPGVDPTTPGADAFANITGASTAQRSSLTGCTIKATATAAGMYYVVGYRFNADVRL